MSYETVEESPQDGLPISLVLVEYGDTHFAYTDADAPVTHNSITYLPTPIGRDKVETSPGLDKSILTVNISPRASLVRMFRGRVPHNPLLMTIFQGHESDGDYQTVWAGRIISLTRRGPYAEISGEPVSSVMRRPGLRRHYQYGCAFALYGAECRANKERATQAATAVEVGKNYVTMAPGWHGTFLPEKFLGGYVQWTDVETDVLQTRTVLAIDGDQAVVNGEVFGLDVDQSLSIVLGCNHQMSDCENLHLNVVNYGGQPWIPLENPTKLTNQFY